MAKVKLNISTELKTSVRKNTAPVEKTEVKQTTKKEKGE